MSLIRLQHLDAQLHVMYVSDPKDIQGGLGTAVTAVTDLDKMPGCQALQSKYVNQVLLATIIEVHYMWPMMGVM